MPPVRLKIDVRGIVQGVGFRPFVYNLAERLALSGHILNNRLGVTIEIEGSEENCRRFLAGLENEPPPLSRISDIETQAAAVEGGRGFRILHSRCEGDEIALISPDNDVCHNCARELLDENDRRYRYPFINCTDCGPRYSIIEETPYDRPMTSMSVFPMCEKCLAEYGNVRDRRFHAQPNACPVCGPSVKLLDGEGKELESSDPIADAAGHIVAGKIVAIKGIGGYHLACDATNEKTVHELRARKVRKEKPFAVMSPDVETVGGYAFVNRQEEILLKSREKPIVLLQKNGADGLAPSIAPGLNEYGVFLPYTPLHYLLFSFDDMPAALVMTSGNVSDEPIVFDDAQLAERLGGIADFFLVNNRRIVWRCDDSVVRARGDETMILRRSRGWVPAPVFADKKSPPMLACGGDLKAVFCLAKGNTIFPGPHIGDLEHAEAFDSYRRSIEHFKSIFRIKPELVAVDKHPRYFSSRYGRGLALPTVEVQHHHAHIASIMLENRIEDKVIGLALDGTGYGDDGTIWGGELLVCDFENCERKFHFPPLKLPGGDMAVKEPWRTATALLYDIYGENIFDAHPRFVAEIGEKKIGNLIMMIKAGVNCPAATSAGRLFDAVSSLLLVRHYNSYDGQAPILLESFADRSETVCEGFSINREGGIDFRELVVRLVEYANGADAAKGASIFHNTIVKALAACCIAIKKEMGITKVCLGGGTFQNGLLLERLIPELEKEGFALFMPKQLPINDGGLSVGQMAVALSRV